MSKSNFKFRLLCSALVLLVTPLHATAEVKSMSLEQFRNVGQDRYWEVAVSCSNGSSEQLMRRTVGEGNKWCSANDTSLCDDSKFALSRKMCGGTLAVVNEESKEKITASSQTANKAAEANAVSANTFASNKETLRTELLKEQVQVEEQRIQIEQKRLELVKSELALKKQLEQN